MLVEWLLTLVRESLIFGFGVAFFGCQRVVVDAHPSSVYPAITSFEMTISGVSARVIRHGQGASQFVRCVVSRSVPNI